MPTTSAPEPDAVQRLLLDEHPAPGRPVLVVDAPALTERLADQQSVMVAAFCDDVREVGSPGPTRVTPHQRPRVDSALIRAPKSLDALDELLAWAHACGAGSVAVGARTKDLTRSMNAVIERRFARVWASRGRDKSRVLFGAEPLPPGRVAHLSPWPRSSTVPVPLGPGLGVVPIDLTRHGGTFGGSRLDRGTRLLLEHLAPTREPARILDWGSGNGTISAALARRWPDAQVTSVDASWAGAMATAATRGVPAPLTDATSPVLWRDGVELLRDEAVAPFDLVVSNPPFHQGVARESGPTLDLLDLAPGRLTDGGEFWLVHNSHLPWAQRLRGAGADVRRVAQDREFTVQRVTAGH